jgi:protein-disulfide isomerase
MSKKQERRSRRQRRADNTKANRLKAVRVGGISILIITVLAFVVFFRASTAPSVDAPEKIMDSNVVGLADAPVRIVEFGDFGCPACRAWHNSGIRDVLMEEYGEDISFTFRHFPVITSQSPRAAEASQCASEQGKFWEYHDYIYEQTSLAALSPDQLKSYAAAIGLDGAQFDRCLDSGKYAGYVSRDRQAAISAGAVGTPTFYINGQLVSFSHDVMVAGIEGILDP